MTILEQIKQSGVVAVIRKATPENIIPLAKALSDGGVKALEITVEAPGAMDAIEVARKELSDEVIVGAGTVLDAETARMAIMAGAKFVVSPTVNPDTIRMSKRYGILQMSGAMTPTEILTAFELGSDVVKVFPASVMGPQYLKDIHGPLPHIPLMPTGGIGLENISDYIKAGAVAVGVGSTLVDASKGASVSYCTELQDKARQFVDRVEAARG